MAGRSRHRFRVHESTLGIETLPQQTGVYIARRLVRERVRDRYLCWHRRRDPLASIVQVP